jgi:hypothetical protein
MWRSLFQSVPAPRLAFDVLPVGASFVRLRPPRRDDAPFLIVFICVHHCDFQTVHQANRIDSGLTVIEPVIDFFNSRPIEDLCRILKRDSVANDVAAFFFLSQL